MGNSVNVLNADIINSQFDVFWEDARAAIADGAPTPVLIITNAYTPGSTEDVQLIRMLDACHLTTGRYRILQLDEEQKIAWYQLRELFDPQIVFLIGILPAHLGVSASFRLNEPNNFNGRIWLPTLSIAELEKNADAKKQLWQNGMKPVFVDKVYGAITTTLPDENNR